MLFSTLVIFASLLRLVSAQTTNATCLASYEWASNSLHQSPCLVAAYALGACVGGAYNVAPLDPLTHYLGPTPSNANACQCSTVAYSLISACGDCQNRTYASWSTWSSNCPTFYVRAFPTDIPPGTSIPAWAYLDVNTNDMYDSALAKSDANATESTAGSKPTTVSTGSLSATAFTTATSAFVSSADASSSTLGGIKPSKSANAIAGAVPGGALGVMILACLITSWFIWRRRKTKLLP